MNIFHHSDSTKPCRPMERLLNDEAEGKAKGLVRWYTLAHAARCPGCGRFLTALRAMLPNLKAMRTRERETMPTARWDALEEAWVAAEATTGDSK